jgi:hypothetical protein
MSVAAEANNWANKMSDDYCCVDVISCVRGARNFVVGSIWIGNTKKCN